MSGLLKRMKMKKHSEKISFLMKQVISNNVVRTEREGKIRYSFMEVNNYESYMIIRTEKDNVQIQRILFGYRDLRKLDVTNAVIDDIKRIFLYDWTLVNGDIREGNFANRYINKQDIFNILEKTS